MADPTKRQHQAHGLLPATAPRLAGFLRLSRILTAQEALDIGLARAYLERAERHLGSQLDDLLDRFESLLRAGWDPVAAVRDELLPSEKFGPSAKTILLLWYIGGLQNADGDWEMESADQYYGALVWEAVGAHPPTLSNGYFGHWKYPPES